MLRRKKGQAEGPPKPPSDDVLALQDADHDEGDFLEDLDRATERAEVLPKERSQK